jgi:hypothetical protein
MKDTRLEELQTQNENDNMLTTSMIAPTAMMITIIAEEQPETKTTMPPI